MADAKSAPAINAFWNLVRMPTAALLYPGMHLCHKEQRFITESREWESTENEPKYKKLFLSQLHPFLLSRSIGLRE